MNFFFNSNSTFFKNKKIIKNNQRNFTWNYPNLNSILPIKGKNNTKQIWGILYIDKFQYIDKLNIQCFSIYIYSSNKKENQEYLRFYELKNKKENSHILKQALEEIINKFSQDLKIYIYSSD